MHELTGQIQILNFIYFLFIYNIIDIYYFKLITTYSILKSSSHFYDQRDKLDKKMEDERHS